MINHVLKIGTRGSALAIKQTQKVEEALRSAHPTLTIERVIIKTSGDWRPEDGEKSLSEIEGGKGLFVREIEKALMDGQIDCAVHSMKDVPSFLPEGLALDHVIEREDARDAFICKKATSFMALAAGSVVGTSSPRRKSILLSKRPDLKVVVLRGNVTTRLAKLEAGVVDATFLAMAGLHRLGVEGGFTYPIETSDMVPACGQGIVAIETRQNDDVVRAMLDKIHHEDTGICGFLERRALQILDGSCHTSIGAHARFLNEYELHMDIFVGSPDGTQIYKKNGKTKTGNLNQMEKFVVEMASVIKLTIPPDIFK